LKNPPGSKDIPGAGLDAEGMAVLLEALKTLQPMGRMVAVEDIVDAVLYLSQAGEVTGEVLHVDGGAHAGRW